LRDLEYVLGAWSFVASEGLLTAACAAIVLFGAASIWALTRPRNSRKAFVVRSSLAAFVALAIGFLGWVAGYMTGMSREPVVGAIVPAVLGTVAVFGGFVAVKYDQSLAIGMMILSLAFCLFVGASVGSHIRQQDELADMQLPSMDFMKDQALAEDEIAKYRKALGLSWPPDPNPYRRQPAAQPEKTGNTKKGGSGD
jgi:hypothetical protein